MSKKLETRYRFRLTVAPDVQHLKDGYFMTQSITDHDVAVRLYKEFVKKGLACVLNTVKVEEVRIDCSDDDVSRYMGLM